MDKSRQDNADILKILFIEDVISDAELIYQEIKRNKISFTKVLVDEKVDYLQSLKVFEPDLIISDYSLPQFDGMQALSLRNELSPLTPFILVTGSINEEVAVDCIKAGADDYILKGNLSRLGPAILNSINKVKLLKEKKAVKEELIKSETRLQKAQSIAHIGNWEVDLSSRTVWCSEEALSIYGFDNESHELLLNLVQKIPLPEFRPVLDEAFDRLLKYNEPYEAEFNIKRKSDGVIRAIYSKAELVQVHDSEQVKVIGVIQDITDRKRAEEALLESKLMIEGIINAIPVRVFWKDKNLVYMGCNEIFARDSGFTDTKDLIGKDDFQMGWRDQAELYRADDQQIIDTGKSKLLIEESQTTPEGNIITLLTSKKPLLNSKGEISGVLGTYIDITDWKENEKELIQAKERAEESDRLKTAFLHNISHEIRTPMNAIVGFSTLLAEPDVDAQSRDSYTEVIMQSSNHLLSIITDIFDISNIEANLVTALKSETNINSVLKKLYNQFVIKADEKRLEFNYQTDLADSDALILSDSTKLMQIISNLLSNAFKFTNSGYIKFGYELKNNLLEFFVTDTGIGIPEVYHKRIFDRFFQVENKKSRLYEGTGLGLAISKAYVELLGGKIWVSSATETTGRGTTFFFTVPLERPVIKTFPDKKYEVSADFIFPDKKTILVAEDIESNFKLITYFLAKSNTSIIRAVNGKEAVEKALSEKNLDLILMDIKMPVMDGYTAIKLIRETNQLIPIIVQTAYAEDKDKAIECGCSGFISKPFDKKSLIKIIREFV